MHVYSPFTFVLRENVFCQCMVVLLNPVCVLLSGVLHVYKSDVSVAVFEDLMTSTENTGFDRSKTIDFFGTVFWQLREARRKETFHTVTDFILSHQPNSK